MHLDEVECVVRELIGNLVPLHGWSAGTVARPVNEEEQGIIGEEEMVSSEREKPKEKPLHQLLGE